MARKRRVGVMGSSCGRHSRARPARCAVEEWGGSLRVGALDAALPPDGSRTILKVGATLRIAREFVAALDRAAPDAAPIEVPHQNNRVALHYLSDEQRCERLSGGVPKWSWLGLKPLLTNLDALYINLISGFELDLETAQLIRQHFRGPIYCDLHSLLLAVQPENANSSAATCSRCLASLLRSDPGQRRRDEHDGSRRDGPRAMAFANGVSSLT